MALGTAGASAAAVNFVAVHGTGTPLGDPIEVGALGAALGTGRSEASQLILGSSKVCKDVSVPLLCRVDGDLFILVLSSNLCNLVMVSRPAHPCEPCKARAAVPSP